MEVVESRRALSSGECFKGSSTESKGLTDRLSLDASSMPRDLLGDTRGVVIEEDEGGRSVRDLTEAEDLDCGLEEVSGASSKVSCFIGQRSSTLLRKTQAYSFLVRVLSTFKLCVLVRHAMLCCFFASCVSDKGSIEPAES